MKARTEVPARSENGGTEDHSGESPGQTASLVASVGTLVIALRRGGASGLALGALSGLLAYRGATGRGPSLPRSGGEMARSLERGLFGRHSGPMHLKTSVTIDKPPEELYQFWRGFSRLPEILTTIVDIQPAGEDRTRWVAKMPTGNTFEWEAEVVEDVPNERIAWRSVEGSTIPQRGEIRFRAGPADRGTEVELDMHYELPFGAVGAAASGFINTLSREAAREDLRHFKQLMETGELPTGSRVEHHKRSGGQR